MAEKKRVTVKEVADGFYSQITNPDKKYAPLRDVFEQLKKDHPDGMPDRDLVKAIADRNPNFSSSFEVTDLTPTATTGPPTMAGPPPTVGPPETGGVVYRAMTPVSEQIGDALGVPNVSLQGGYRAARAPMKEQTAKMVSATPPLLQPVVKLGAGIVDTFDEVNARALGMVDAMQSPVGMAFGVFGKVASMFPSIAPIASTISKWAGKGMAAAGVVDSGGRMATDIPAVIKDPSGTNVGRVVADVGEGVLSGMGLKGKIGMRPKPGPPVMTPVGPPVETPVVQPQLKAGRGVAGELPAPPSPSYTSHDVATRTGVTMDDARLIGKLSVNDLRTRRQMLSRAIESETSPVDDVVEGLPDKSGVRGGQEGARPGEAGPRESTAAGRKIKRVTSTGETLELTENDWAVRRRNELTNQLKAVDLILEDKLKSVMPGWTEKPSAKPGPPQTNRVIESGSKKPTVESYDQWKKRNYQRDPTSGNHENRNTGQLMTEERLHEEYGDYVAARTKAPPATARPLPIPPDYAPTGNPLAEGPPPAPLGLPEPELGRAWTRPGLTAPEINQVGQRFGVEPDQLAEVAQAPLPQINEALNDLHSLYATIKNQYGRDGKGAIAANPRRDVTGRSLSDDPADFDRVGALDDVWALIQSIEHIVKLRTSRPLQMPTQLQAMPPGPPAMTPPPSTPASVFLDKSTEGTSIARLQRELGLTYEKAVGELRNRGWAPGKLDNFTWYPPTEQSGPPVMGGRP